MRLIFSALLLKLKTRVSPSVFRIYFVVFGPVSIIATAYLIEKGLTRVIFSVLIGKIPVQLLFSIQTGYNILLLGFLSAYFILSLNLLRKIIPYTWNRFTPPFAKEIELSNQDASEEKIKEAERNCFWFLIAGVVFAYCLPLIFGFTPFRRGYIRYFEWPIPSFLGQLSSYGMDLPIISDLTLLSEFISAPDLFGYFIIAIPLVLIAIGTRNLIYLFRIREVVLSTKHDLWPEWRLFIKWMPHFGLLLSIAIVWFET